MSEEDCQEALSLLLELAKPVEEEGFGYAPALLTVASLYESGFEPGIARNTPQAARCYLALMESQIPCATLGPELLEEAATQLCGLVKACKANLQDTEIRRLEELLQKCEAQRGVAGWLRFASDVCSERRRCARCASRSARSSNSVRRRHCKWQRS